MSGENPSGVLDSGDSLKRRVGQVADDREDRHQRRRIQSSSRCPIAAPATAAGSGLPPIDAMMPPIAPSMVLPGLTLKASLCRPMARPTKYAPVSAQITSSSIRTSNSMPFGPLRTSAKNGNSGPTYSAPLATAIGPRGIDSGPEIPTHDDVQHRDRQHRHQNDHARARRGYGGGYSNPSSSQISGSSPNISSAKIDAAESGRIARRLRRGPTEPSTPIISVNAQSGRKKIAARRVGSATAAVRSLVLSTQPVVAVGGNSAEPALARLIRGQRGREIRARGNQAIASR